MADSKITALTALTAADPINDMFPAVDVSDTSMAASGTTKRISINNILSSSPTASGALTVTGLVTAGSATITDALTVDTTTLVVNPSGYADRVGIGLATPSQALHVRGNIQTGSAAGTDSYLNITTDGVQNSYMGFNNSGSTNASGASNNHQYIANGNGYPIQIATNGVSIATFSTAAVTLTAQNLVMATSGKGIDFSATANSSGTMTSELLADYEEGTWVPVLGGDGGTSGQTYSLQVGRYTKVGRQVICSFEATLTAVGTVTGNAIISGLPFSSVSTSLNTDGGTTTIGFANNLATNQIFITGYLNGAGAYSFITGIAAAGTAISNITATNIFGNTTRLSGTITYTAS